MNTNNRMFFLFAVLPLLFYQHVVFTGGQDGPECRRQEHQCRHSPPRLATVPTRLWPTRPAGPPARTGPARGAKWERKIINFWEFYNYYGIF